MLYSWPVSLYWCRKLPVRRWQRRFTPIDRLTIMLSPSNERLVHFSLPFYLSSQPFQVELVWKRRWGLGTALFVFNRYSPFVESIISLSSESAACTGQPHLNICESPAFLPHSAGLCLSCPDARREPVAYIPHRCARNLQQFSHVSTSGTH